MNCFDATEQAYKNGYEAGYRAGRWSVGITDKEKEELQFVRQFIHEHGLDFALASAWNRRAEDG